GGETEMPLTFGLGYTGVWAIGRWQDSNHLEYAAGGLGLTFRPKVRHWLSERFAIWGAAEGGVAGPEGTTYGNGTSYGHHQTISVTALLRVGVTYDVPRRWDEAPQRARRSPPLSDRAHAETALRVK